MDPPWRIEMLGGLRIRADTQVVERFPTRRVALLLARLALSPGRVFGREELIELLWPEGDPVAGRHNLRQALHSLRALFGTACPIVSDHTSVWMDAAAVGVDVARFEAGLAAASRATGRERADRLAAALEHYGGDLLPGHYAEWALLERERLAARYEEALEALSELRVRKEPAAVRTPHNLAEPLTRFFGRDRERAEVVSLLSCSRLVTLTGAGGCGKTRLALSVGREVLPRYPDGVFVVELAALTDPGRVGAAVAGALGIADLSEDIAEGLRRALGDRRLLLILDNGEHLRDGCGALCSGLLRGCPGLSVLATSREPLGVAGEVLYRVPGLTASASSDLFVDRARSVGPELGESGADASYVSEVCRRLDGIPLAIELAAARTAHLRLSDLVSRLEDRFRLLTGGSRLGLPRHQTLRATVDWSYDLLTSEEQVLLSRLSVFVGGWSLEAAEGICSGEGIGEGDVLDLLSHLVDKSLVQVEGGRYRMLETIRQYALEKCDVSGESDHLHARHRDWFRRRVEAQFERYAYHDEALAMEALSQDQENLLRAIRGAAAQSDHESVLALAGLTRATWTSPVTFAMLQPDLQEALGHRVDTEESFLYGYAMIAEAVCAYFMGDLEAARVRTEQALAMQRHLENPVGVADALHLLVQVYGTLGRYDESVACCREAIALTHARGMRSWEYSNIGNLGNTLLRQGDLDGAEPYLLESLREPGIAPDHPTMGPRLDCLGELRLRRGDVAEAVAIYEGALQINARAGHWREVGFQLGAFAHIALLSGDVPRCVRLHGAIAELRRRFFLQPFPHEVEATERDLATARSLLPAEAFAQDFASGRAFSTEEAVAYAREVAGDPEPE